MSTSTSKRIFKFDDLNEYVIGSVLSYLPIRERVNLELLNSNVQRSSSALWSQLKAINPGEDFFIQETEEYSYLKMILLSSNIREFNLERCFLMLKSKEKLESMRGSFITRLDLEVEVCSEVGQMCPRIEKFGKTAIPPLISYITRVGHRNRIKSVHLVIKKQNDTSDENMKFLFEYLNHLQKLILDIEISNDDFLDGVMDEEPFKQLGQRVKILKFTKPIVYELLAPARNLIQCHHDFVQLPSDFNTRHPDLATLDSIQATIHNLSIIIKMFNIKSITINFSNVINQLDMADIKNLLIEFFRRHPNLKSLAIKSCQFELNGLWCMLSQYCPWLKNLELHNIRNKDYDKEFNQSLKRFINLRSLTIIESGCLGTRPQILELLHRLPKLKKITFKSLPSGLLLRNVVESYSNRKIEVNLLHSFSELRNAMNRIKSTLMINSLHHISQ